MVREHHQHSNIVCEALDEKFTENSAAFDARLQNQHQYFTDACTTLENRLTENSASQDAQMENQRLQLTELWKSVDRKFEGTCSALEKRGDELAKVIEGDRKHFTDACDGLEKALSAKNAAQDERTDSLRDSLRKVADKFSDVCNDLERQWTEADAAQTVRVQGNHNEVLERCTRLDSKLDTGLAAQANRCASVPRPASGAMVAGLQDASLRNGILASPRMPDLASSKTPKRFAGLKCWRAQWSTTTRCRCNTLGR
jgi:molecular chaperone GrpE (heat shock protein)